MGDYCLGNHFHHDKHRCTGSSIARYNHAKYDSYYCDSLFHVCYDYPSYSSCSSGYHCHHGSGMSFWGSLGLGFATSALSWLTGRLNGGNSWFGGGNSWFGGPSWQNGGSWYSSNQPQTPGQNTTIVNNGNIDTDTLAGFNNRFDEITKPGYDGSDTLDALKKEVEAKIQTQEDSVQNSNDIINYKGLFRAIDLYEKNNSSSNPVNQNQNQSPVVNNGTGTGTGTGTGVGAGLGAGTMPVNDSNGYHDIDKAILSAVDSLTYTDEQGYTNAEEDDLSSLNADNVEFARDVEGFKKNNPQKIKDISGTVTVEDNGKTIKINDSDLDREITYKCIGKTTSGKMVYVDTTSNSKQVYILQKNTSTSKYALMQYGEMDGSVVVAQSK